MVAQTSFKLVYKTTDHMILYFDTENEMTPDSVYELRIIQTPFSDVPECKCLEANSRIDCPQVVPTPLWSRNGGVLHAQVLHNIRTYTVSITSHNAVPSPW